jgi:seryl-tRNA synthetase
MIDIKAIRENPERFKTAARNKRMNCDIDAICALDDRRRVLQTEMDQVKHRQNEIGEQIAGFRNPKSRQFQEALAAGRSQDELKAEAAKLVEQVSEMKARVKQLETEHREACDQLDAALLTVAQPAADEVPIGKDDTENVEVRRVGEIPKFDFEPQDHVTLMTRLQMLDVDRGVKLAGTRNYVLRGDGSALHQAVLRLALDMMVQRGFVQMSVPVLVRDAMMVGTGYFPGGEEQAYRCERDAMSLVGTAEVPLTAYHSDEILTEEELPKKYVACSTCFRREAGAAGKDTYGLYRIHLLDLVEQVDAIRRDRPERGRRAGGAGTALPRGQRLHRRPGPGPGPEVRHRDLDALARRVRRDALGLAFLRVPGTPAQASLPRRQQNHAVLPHSQQHGDRQPANPDRPGREPSDGRWTHSNTQGAAALHGRARNHWRSLKETPCHARVTPKPVLN